MNSNGIDRRNFIILGSTVAAGLAAMPLRAQMAGAGAQVFVGFAPTQGRSRVTGRSGAAIFAADSISTTEPSLSRTGARLSIRSLSRPHHRPFKFQLDVMHDVEGVDARVPFQAWTYDRSAADARSSNPVAFTVPVGPVAPLDLVFSIGSGSAAMTHRVSLSVARAEGAIPLNTGSYLFAIGDRAPDWSSLQLDQGRLTEGREGTPVSFDHLIITVSTPPA